jgi:hypothetical protein
MVEEEDVELGLEVCLRQASAVIELSILSCRSLMHYAGGNQDSRQASCTIPRHTLRCAQQ